MEKKKEANKHIRKGDKVVAIAGNYRGQTGTVLSRTEDRVLVQGLNFRKKHLKKSQSHPNGTVLSVERPIHASNLMICVEGDTPAKIKVEISKKGQKSLYYMKDGKKMTYRQVKGEA